MTQPIGIGKTAPNFALQDQAGKEHRLPDYRGSWVILYFYPRDNTPGCTTEACDFRDTSEAIKEQHAAVLGISPDDQASHARFANAKSLNFPILSDTDQATCTAYGVWQEKKNFGKTYMGVVRTTYLIDPKGNIAHRWDRVRVANHAAAVLSKLRELTSTT